MIFYHEWIKGELRGNYIKRGVSGVVRDQEVKMEEVKVSHTLGGVGEEGTYDPKREVNRRREFCEWEG